MTKRNEPVVPPPPPGGYEVKAATSDAAKGWDELRQSAPVNLYEAYMALSTHPTAPVNRRRQHPLKADFARVVVHGTPLDQWQYEVTAGGRIWYAVDETKRVVWVTLASGSHPKTTE